MSDTKPEIKVRSEGGQVVVQIIHPSMTPHAYWEIPLSTEDATRLASTLYSIAAGIEAVRIKEEREGGLAAIIKNMPIAIEAIRQGLEANKEDKPETWRDRESML